MTDAENWSRASFFEQRATEYLKATKSPGARVSLTVYGRRSKSGTADRAADLRVAWNIYRLLSVAEDPLECPPPPDAISRYALHSHSIVPGGFEVTS